MSIPRLKFPRAWIEQFVSDRIPDLNKILAIPSKPVLLALSVSGAITEQMEEAGIGEKDVRVDAASGCTIEQRDSSRDGYYYIVKTSHYTFYINPDTGNDSGKPTAKLTKLDTQKNILDPNRIINADISLSPLWDEKLCDMEQAYSVARQRADNYNQYKQKFSEITRETTRRPQLTSDDDKERLHGLALKQYGALRLLLELLHIQSEVEDQPNGTISIMECEPDTEGRGCLVEAELIQLDGKLFPDDIIELTSSNGDRPLRGRILDKNKSHLSLSLKSNAQLENGTQLGIEKKARFQYGQHERALQAFLTENTAGEWESLVNLLCIPDKLSEITPVHPKHWFSEEGKEGHTLNEQQKTAVAGAVNAPSTFFIQGPPGTGKTTVICEIVQQLLAKGERVLLVASTHVAVDEVLRRIGNSKGIYPLRVTWDPTRVDEDLRRFTFNELSRTLKARFLEGVPTRGCELSSRYKVISERKKVLDKLKKAQSALEVAQESEVEARNTRDLFEDKTQQEIRKCESTNVELNTQDRTFSERVSSYKGHLTKIESEIENIKRKKKGIGRFFSEVFGEISSAKSKSNKYRKKLQSAEKSLNHTKTQQIRNNENLSKLRQSLDKKGKDLSEALSLTEAALTNKKAKRDKAFKQCSINSDAELKAALAELKNYKVRVKQLRSCIELNDKLSRLMNEAEDSPDENSLMSELDGYLLQGVNLVCATTEGIAGSPHVREQTFDTLIVDEASRVTDAQLLISAIRTKRWILVGDEKQLPPYFGNQEEYHLHALCALLMSKNNDISLEQSVENLAAIWEKEDDEELHIFRNQSVLDVAMNLMDSGRWKKHYRSILTKQQEYYKNDGEHTDLSEAMLYAMREKLVDSFFGRAVTDLNPSLRRRLIVQRRMIGSIARIVSKPIYDGEFQTPDEDVLHRSGIIPLVTPLLSTPISLIDTTVYGEKAVEELIGNGFVNELEARQAVGVCKHLEDHISKSKDGTRITVSILCFYKAQARRIDALLGGREKNKRYKWLKFSVIDAIDKIQGQESDVVIISFCRARKGRIGKGFGKWLQDLRRLNVALTRAHRALILIGHVKTLKGLSTFDRSEQFYEHLFKLFETYPEDMKIHKQISWNANE